MIVYDYTTISEISVMLLSRSRIVIYIFAGFLLCANPVVGQVAQQCIAPTKDSALADVQLTLPRDTLLRGIDRLFGPRNISQMGHDTSAAERDTSLSRIDTLAVIRDTVRIGMDTLVVRDTLLIKSDTLVLDTFAIRPDTLVVRRDTLDIISSEAGLNTLPGFRVQLLSTQNLLEAITAKAKADSLLKDFNVYIVYDSPYYKVRVGDFHARYEANRAVSYIAGHGFPDAWPVPDNIFRNPPKKNNN
ncbi:MAG: SPOR domain-containing protein [Bacteroidetes bacterium]|nr:SPOR domain-containing protein [Bacteroidota bacterium]